MLSFIVVPFLSLRVSNIIAGLNFWFFSYREKEQEPADAFAVRGSSEFGHRKWQQRAVMPKTSHRAVFLASV